MTNSSQLSPKKLIMQPFLYVNVNYTFFFFGWAWWLQTALIDVKTFNNQESYKMFFSLP